MERLRRAGAESHKAKDLLRASGLALLPSDDPHVKKDLKKVERGDLLSPLIVADGYHRICASYHLDEDADIPCRIVDLP